MSTKTPVKRNVRREIRQTLASKPAKVYLGKKVVGDVALAHNQEPGHRDLGLIPQTNKHGQYLALGGELVGVKRGGSFGGVTKTERTRLRRAKLLRAARESAQALDTSV